MISLSATTGGVRFTFENSAYYLYGNGTIDVPLNSLLLMNDESDSVTFKKIDGDVFISAPVSEFDMSKSEIEEFYENNMVGGGVDPADVLDIVESATSYYDGVEYDSVNSRINFKHNNVVEAYVDAAPFIVDGMVSDVAISGGNLVITFNTDSGKQPISIPLTDIFDPSNYYNKTAIDTIISGITDDIIDDEEVISSALNDLNERKLDASAYTPTDLTNYYNKTEVNGLLDDKLDASAYTPTDLTNYYTKSETSGATEISTALAGKADTATTYTKTEVDTALGGKQATLVSGTNIKTINNESLLGSGNIDIQGGGGSSYTAGRGIDIDTGNTISFNLPISAGTGSNSIIMGKDSNIASGTCSFAGGGGISTLKVSATNDYSFAFGANVSAKGLYSAVFGSGNYVEATGTFAAGLDNYIYGNFGVGFGHRVVGNNQSETSLGNFNVSNKSNTTFGDSGNTLFSVGNGTANNARHNAFEIRQNGDIYITKNGADVKLQDQLGGGSASSAITSGDTNAVQGGAVYDKFDEVEQVTAAALNLLNTNMGGLKFVKLSQQEYDDLAVKDSSTMYIII